MAVVQGYEQLRRRLIAISGTQGSSEVMRALGFAAVREQKLLVRRRTDTTGRTIRVGAVSATSVTTVAGGAAVFLEEGTRPHLITPKAGMALRFAAKGVGVTLAGRVRSGEVRRLGNAAFVFAKVVHHPGTRAYPFMLPGAKLAVQRTGLIDAIVSKWNESA